MQTPTPQLQERQALNLAPPPSELSANDERMMLVLNALQTLQAMPQQQPVALQHLQPQPRPQIYIDPWAVRIFAGGCTAAMLGMVGIGVLNSLPNAQQTAATRELLRQQQAAIEAIANKPASQTCIAIVCPPAPPPATSPNNHLPAYNGGQY